MASLSFDTSAWSTGVQPLGFGDTTIKTNVTQGFLTYYFRKIVTLTSINTTINPVGTLNFLCDDSAVVYVNEQLVGFRNILLPDSGVVNASTPASAWVAGVPGARHSQCTCTGCATRWGLPV